MSNFKMYILKKFDNSIYEFLSKNLKIIPNRFKKAVAYYYPDARIRKIYLDDMGVFMDEGTYSNLGLIAVIGENKEKYSVKIGKNVSIAPNVTLVCDSNPNNSKMLCYIPYVKKNLIKNEQIIIEDEVWIGANVTILPGVTIKKGSIIGAGSVVLEDTEPFSIYTGVPARFIRTLNTDS